MPVRLHQKSDDGGTMTDSQRSTLQLLELIRSSHIANMHPHVGGRDPGWFYKGPADLLIREGRWYNDGRAKRWSHSIPHGCFRNAALFAMEHRLPYVEGYATCIIPVHHAWCLDHDGRILEVSWKTLGTDYFGVQFDPHLVKRGAVLFHEPNTRIYKRRLKGAK